MNDLWTFELTDDSGLMALIDPDTYSSFVSEDLTFDKFRAHCLAQMAQHRMLIWGTGVEATWRVEVRLDQSAPPGFREIVGGISTSRGRLALVNYEDLSMAAMYPDQELPLPHASHILDVPAAMYECRIVQLHDPGEFGEDLQTPGFVIQLRNAPTIPTWTNLPWFE